MLRRSVGTFPLFAESSKALFTFKIFATKLIPALLFSFSFFYFLFYFSFQVSSGPSFQLGFCSLWGESGVYWPSGFIFGNLDRKTRVSSTYSRWFMKIKCYQPDYERSSMYDLGVTTQGHLTQSCKVPRVLVFQAYGSVQQSRSTLPHAPGPQGGGHSK